MKPLLGESGGTLKAQTNPFQVGSLVYTKMGLVSVFSWLLWGNFCFIFMETVLPVLLPVMLKDSGASNFTINLLPKTLPLLLTGCINPIVAVKSDRFRSRRGRRIPFLLFGTPFVTLFLILTGYSTEIGGALHAWMAAHAAHPAMTKATVILGVIAVGTIGFMFFNMFVAPIYYYLLVDVVPEPFMGRFIALFNLVGLVASWIWNYFILGYASHHMNYVFLGSAVLYFLAFTFLCLRVKEGEYPPPPAAPPRPGRLHAVKSYFRDCFTERYYIWFFLGTSLYTMSGSASVFFILFCRDTLGLTLDQFGKINSWCVLLLMVVTFPAGWLVDKIRPLRVVLISMTAMFLVAFLAFFLIQGRTSLLIYLIAGSIPGTLYATAYQPMCASVLPKDRYGQFYSARSLVSSVCEIVGSIVAGLFFDWVKNYRYMFLWQTVFMVASLVPFVLLYLAWRRKEKAQTSPASPAC